MFECFAKKKNIVSKNGKGYYLDNITTSESSDWIGA